MRTSLFAFALLLAAASSAIAAGQQTQSQIAPSGIAQISLANSVAECHDSLRPLFYDANP